MYKRSLKVPNHTFFLFGPRGTGKTTWLKQRLASARWYDLLRGSELLRLMQDPDVFAREVTACPKGSWIVVDEVQRVPGILDEVHRLITDHGDEYRFALSGSSARKLKRCNANLLAGRAINRKFFPLTGEEVNYDFDTDDILRFGMLPKVVSDPDYAVDILEAYAETYLQQEIQQEAVARDLVSFSRFLQVTSLANGKVTNMANIARDCGISHGAVQHYFDVLISTLIGIRLPAWQPRAKVKEKSHPKFYLFDAGVVRAVANRLREPVDRLEAGPLLETIVLSELRAFQNVANRGGALSYWATPSGQEIDFVWTRGKQAVGLEVKASPRWRPAYGKALKGLHRDGVLKRCFGVFLGEREQKDGPVTVLPLKDFMRRLSRGEVIG